LDTNISHGKETISSSPDEYRTSVKNLIQNEVGGIVDEEMRKAAQDIVEEQRKAITEAVDEYKSVIKQVVEEEKTAIRMKMGEIRRSIIKLGLG
jgi:polyhydroxyalkanoate synthesis regulator phasin